MSVLSIDQLICYKYNMTKIRRMSRTRQVNALDKFKTALVYSVHVKQLKYIDFSGFQTKLI